MTIQRPLTPVGFCCDSFALNAALFATWGVLRIARIERFFFGGDLTLGRYFLPQRHNHSARRTKAEGSPHRPGRAYRREAFDLARMAASYRGARNSDLWQSKRQQGNS